MLFVGINPGVRSAQTGHHFAGHSNRFWKLLYDSRLVPVPLTAFDDRRLPEWGLGLTNLVPRPTRGISDLRPEDYRAGVRALRRKIRRWRPALIALVGLTLPRAIFGHGAGSRMALGLQPESLEGVQVFVLPNPSGRNAHYSYDEMRDAFSALRRHMDRTAG
ncbi:MAG: mismatch-specific DNA-glycosylase [Vicinamibacterales bacterium]